TELSSLEILRLCERQMISHLDLPAGLWRQWVDDVATVGVAVPPSLEVFMTGGESVPWEKLRRWAALSERPMHFLSSYGPTEATVTTTLFQTTRELPAAPDLPNIPIGEPLPGVQLLVLDRFLQPAGIGVPGEVYIGGVGVSRGYLGRPGRTARAFVPHPPAGARGGKAGERCYRTGDLARHLPDGSVEFLGRADRQVKVRGFRIEVGDIETALAHHPQVEEVAVVLHQPAQGSGEDQLVAYVVAEAERPPHAGSLRAFVAERLPHFMVPAVVVFVDRMPVTANGKVDLEALPPPEPGLRGSEEEFVAPRTTTEERLVEIWSDVLDAERIGVFDNLFALGGQSLLAVQLIARVQAAFGVEIPLRRLYEQGTVADLAVAVDAALAERSNDDVTTSAAATETLIAETEQRHRPFPLMPVQEVYLSGQSGLYDLGACGSNAYIELEIGGPAEPFLLRFEQALNRVIARHDMLRAILQPDGQQRILDRVPLYRIARFDLRRLAESAQAALAEMQNTLRYRRLTAGHWPHFELVACRLEDSRTRLLIRIAAVLIDGGSRDLVVADLFRLLADPAADLPPLELSYRDCVLAWSAARDSAPYRRARSYWLRQLPTLPPAPELPLARPLTPETASRFVIRSLTPLDVDAWAAFKRHAADAALTPSSAILTAFTEILARWSHRDEFTLGLVGTNPRPAHPQAEQIVGNFNTLHLLTVRAATGSFADCARQIQDHMAANLEHQAFSGLEVLRELNRTRYRSSRAAMPILFNSVIELAQPAGQAGEDATDQEPAPAETQVRQVEANLYAPQILLSPTVFETAGGDLGCKWQAVDELFPPGLMDHMSEAFTALLQCLAGISDAWQQPVDELLPTTTPAVRFAGAPTEAASSEMIAEPASVTADPQLEARIVTIWQELLEIESVAPDDDFFELGGNSLLAALLQTRLRRELRIEQPLARFFERPTVAALVNELARRQTTPPHLAEAR
ncbi:MAG: phosphopantetheine-binding protein, partial [Acidobacteriota bacterium]